jgi:hypothetical protein
LPEVIGSLHPVTLSTGSTAYTKKWVPGVQKEKYQRNGAPTTSEPKNLKFGRNISCLVEINQKTNL